MSDAVEVVAGFSKINRWLLYTSFMLSPAQFASGWKSNCPSNLGFLAYNWYTQISWYKAVKNQELHALSLLPSHFNTIYAFTYLGGVSSGNIVMGVLLGFGSAGVIILNDVASWMSWATNQPEGYGVYQFFFFGWRTLDDGRHKFILAWQIFNSIATFSSVIGIISLAFYAPFADDDDEIPWWSRYPLIIAGAAVALVIGWPLIMWTELIVQKNNIISDTDWVAVWLFIAQVGTMIIPSCGL